MNYYDKAFRQNLMDLLNNYRKTLVHLETEGELMRSKCEICTILYQLHS